jgi:hypothetical protein
MNDVPLTKADNNDLLARVMEMREQLRRMQGMADSMYEVEDDSSAQWKILRGMIYHALGEEVGDE